LVVISLILVIFLAMPLAVSAEPGGGGGGAPPPYEPPPVSFSICIIGDGYDYQAPPVAPPNDDCQGEDEG